LVLFILMNVGYNMDVTCNQKFMFCMDRGIDFSVWLCLRYTWYAHPALLWFSILPPGTFRISTLRPNTFWDLHFTTRHYGDSHLNAHWTKKGCFPTVQPSSKTKFSVQVWQITTKNSCKNKYLCTYYLFISN